VNKESTTLESSFLFVVCRCRTSGLKWSRSARRLRLSLGITSQRQPGIPSTRNCVLLRSLVAGCDPKVWNSCCRQYAERNRRLRAKTCPPCARATTRSSAALACHGQHRNHAMGVVLQITRALTNCACAITAAKNAPAPYEIPAACCRPGARKSIFVFSRVCRCYPLDPLQPGRTWERARWERRCRLQIPVLVYRVSTVVGKRNRPRARECPRRHHRTVRECCSRPVAPAAFGKGFGRLEVRLGIT